MIFNYWFDLQKYKNNNDDDDDDGNTKYILSLFLTAISLSIYSGMSLLYLKNHTNEQNIMIPHIPVIIRTHLNAPGSSNIGISKFIPNMPATTPKMATTKVAVVSSSSNWISWFRTLSCEQNNKYV